MSKSKIVYRVLTIIFLFEISMAFITRDRYTISRLIMNILEKDNVPNSWDGLGDAMIVWGLWGVFLITYIILFLINVKKEQNKKTAIFPLIICICTYLCFLTVARIIGTVEENTEIKQTNEIILSTPIYVDLTEIGLGCYREVNSIDFGMSREEFYLVDTSKEIDNGYIIFNRCSYEDFFAFTYYEKQFKKEQMYYYNGIELYFKQDGSSDEIWLRKEDRIYEIYSVYEKEKIGWDKYVSILENVKNKSNY